MIGSNKPVALSWSNGKFLFLDLFAKGSLLPNAEIPRDDLISGPYLVDSWDYHLGVLSF